MWNAVGSGSASSVHQDRRTRARRTSRQSESLAADRGGTRCCKPPCWNAATATARTGDEAPCGRQCKERDRQFGRGDALHLAETAPHSLLGHRGGTRTRTSPIRWHFGQVRFVGHEGGESSIEIGWRWQQVWQPVWQQVAVAQTNRLWSSAFGKQKIDWVFKIIGIEAKNWKFNRNLSKLLKLAWLFHQKPWNKVY